MNGLQSMVSLRLAELLVAAGHSQIPKEGASLLPAHLKHSVDTDLDIIRSVEAAFSQRTSVSLPMERHTARKAYVWSTCIA